VIRLVTSDKQAAADRPIRIGVSARSLAGIAPGDYVAATTRLLPPPEAARPGGYDFARDAYFRGIDAWARSLDA
jgi:competence protein ComEC